jgi:hypothetical protein
MQAGIIGMVNRQKEMPTTILTVVFAGEMAI